MENKNNQILSVIGIFAYMITTYTGYTIYKIWSSADNQSLTIIEAIGPLVFIWFISAAISVILIFISKLGELENIGIQVLVALLIMINIIFAIFPIISILSTGGFERMIIGVVLTFTPTIPLIYLNFKGFLNLRN